LVTSGFEVLASSLGFMAASAFVSDERVLNTSTGVAQLRLANLVQGDWLSGASQVTCQDGTDHLMRAGPSDDLPGTSGLVRVQFVDPVYRDRAGQDTQGIGKFPLPARPNLVFRVHGCWGDPASEPESARQGKYSEQRRPAWRRARGRPPGLADAQAASPHPPDG
jgi:hypothetical protein